MCLIIMIATFSLERAAGREQQLLILVPRVRETNSISNFVILSAIGIGSKSQSGKKIISISNFVILSVYLICDS